MLGAVRGTAELAEAGDVRDLTLGAVFEAAGKATDIGLLGGFGLLLGALGGRREGGAGNVLAVFATGAGAVGYCELGGLSVVGVVEAVDWRHDFLWLWVG